MNLIVKICTVKRHIYAINASFFTVKTLIAMSVMNVFNFL